MEQEIARLQEQLYRTQVELAKARKWAKAWKGSAAAWRDEAIVYWSTFLESQEKSDD